MKKPAVFVVAYWHDRRFKKKTGGLVRMLDLGTNLDRLGVDAVLFLPRIGNPKRQTSARVIEIPFIDLPVLRPLSFQLGLLMVLLFTDFRTVDYLYVRQMNSFLPHMVAKLRRIPIIYEIPNDPYLPANALPWAKRVVIGQIEKFCLQLADRVVVLSEWSKQRLAARQRLPDAKIHVLVSGSDADLFRPLSKAQCCHRTRMDPNGRYIGFVGSFLAHQGVETLIKASPSLAKADHAVKFLMVGDGPLMAKWKAAAEAMGMHDRFIFTGHVPYDQVPYYIGAMDICVAPFNSDSNQASPVKIFDYMACAKPIVASDLPAVREIVGNSRCAELVPAGSADALSAAIIDLLADNARREAMAAAGRKRMVEKYSRTAIAGDLMAIGKSIADPRSRRP